MLLPSLARGHELTGANSKTVSWGRSGHILNRPAIPAFDLTTTKALVTAMHFLGLATFALGIGLALASPALRSHVRHERRLNSPHWIKRTKAAPETTLPVRIGLAQPNLHIGHDLLLEISDPRSEKYGQYMSAQEVGDLFRPSGASIDAVRDWLHNSGIDNERHEISAGRGWLKFEASVDELESLLATQYHIFHHMPTQEDHIGCSEYHVPQHIQEHIDFITPTVSFAKVKGRDKMKKSISKSLSPAALNPHVTPAGSNVFISDSEVPCYAAVTPDCIRRMLISSVYFRLFTESSRIVQHSKRYYCCAWE